MKTRKRTPNAAEAHKPPALVIPWDEPVRHVRSSTEGGDAAHYDLQEIADVLRGRTRMLGLRTEAARLIAVRLGLV